MLTYERNKLVRIWKKNNAMEVSGILDDDLYSLELQVTVDIRSLAITAVTGKWNRWTTPECPRAVAPLQDAVGFRLDDPDFSQSVHKVIGRNACRHFANLLLECGHAAREAADVLAWDTARRQDPGLTMEAFLGAGPGDAGSGTGDRQPSQPGPEPSPAPRSTAASVAAPTDRPAEKPGTTDAGGMAIDLHTHSWPASPCSSAAVDDLIIKARATGLDGICLTDHNYLWDRNTVEALKEKHDFLILRGNEITTDQGDMLVFGLEENIKGIIRLEDLSQKVRDAGGVIIAAHPFRGFLTFGITQLGLTVKEAARRPMFQHVTAVETRNGKVTEKENRFAAEVAAALNLPATGGSDAHLADEAGLFATRFMDRIHDETSLIQALLGGRYSPVAFRHPG